MNLNEFMDFFLQHFPDGEMGVDNDGQVVIYTGLQFLTPLDNPTIPEGECLIVPYGG